MSLAVFTSFLLPYMTLSTAELLEDSWDSDAGGGGRSCSMSLSLELPRGAQERCMGVEIIVSQMPGSCSRNGQRSDSLCAKNG